MFQDPEHQFVTSTVYDELALGPRRIGLAPTAVASTVDGLLDRLRLAHLAGANPYTLSGGEARRLSVATALATAPRLLVLDEPTFGQDRRTWLELVDLLAALRDDGHAVVAVTHDADFVAALADRTVPAVSLTARDRSARDAPLARRNPVAKLLAATLFSVALLATLDPLTPALAIVVELALLPLFGVRLGMLARRAWPLRDRRRRRDGDDRAVRRRAHRRTGVLDRPARR